MKCLWVEPGALSAPTPRGKTEASRGVISVAQLDGCEVLATRGAGCSPIPPRAHLTGLYGLERLTTLAMGAASEVRSIHWSPYDRVGVMNADP